MQTRHRRHERPLAATTTQWEAWQSSEVAEQYLSPDARALGYTVLRVPPVSRAMFLEMIELLALYSAVAQIPTHQAASRQVWRVWQGWTRRLCAYLRRLAAGHAGTLPGIPEEWLT